MLEIERKFKLTTLDILKGRSGERISQGYLSKDPQRTVRVRTKGQKAYITIKGKSSSSGATRYEWEHSILINEAIDLLKMCLPGIIEKTRYEVMHEGHLWEIDVFHGENKGLHIAEIELKDEKEPFLKPYWLGKEVTGDHRYYNSHISSHSFTLW